MIISERHVLLLITVSVFFMADEQDYVLGKVVSLPHVHYVLEGDQGSLRCQNRSEDELVFYNFIWDANWYKLFPNGSTFQYGETGPIHVIGYALFFYPTVRPEDQGQYYCCQPNGPCSSSSNVTRAVAPVFEVINSDYYGLVGFNITMVCRIIFHGSPLATFGWRKNGQWLRDDDDHVTFNSTHFSLTLIDLSMKDSGNYRCASEGVPLLITRSVNLHVQVPPQIMMYGPATAILGTIISINCTVIQGQPGIHIVTPSGYTVDSTEITFNATLDDMGNYTCVATTSGTTVTKFHTLIVHAPPWPVSSRQSITIPAGADVILPCISESANPAPLYNWQHLPPNDSILQKEFHQLDNGSLLLTDVHVPGIFKCTAWNEYGTSTQIIYLYVDGGSTTESNKIINFLVSDFNNRCIENFSSNLSVAFQDYIQEICGCKVKIPTRYFKCINKKLAVYSIELVDQILRYIVSLLMNSTVTGSIDLGIALLSACNQSCDGQLQDFKDPDHKGSNDYTHKLAIVSVLSAVLPVIFIAVLTFYCTYRRKKKMDTSVCGCVRQRKASDSSQADALEEMEVAGDDAEITSSVVPQSPTDPDFDDIFHPVPQADDESVLQTNPNDYSSVSCVPKEAVSSTPGVMCDKTGGKRRCNEAFSAHFRGNYDVEQPVATTDDYHYVKEPAVSNQILTENEYNKLSNTGLECTVVSLPVTCSAEETKPDQRSAATSYIFTENSMRIVKDSKSLTAIIPPLSLMVANNGTDYDDVDIVPSKDHVSYVDIVRRKQ